MWSLSDILCRYSAVNGHLWSWESCILVRNGSIRSIKVSIGCSAKSLTDTLKLLEANEIIIRTVQPTMPVTVEYSLTEKGRDFEGVFYEMRKWGAKWLEK